MNFSLLLPLLITTLVAIVSWFVGHHLSVGRDHANKRRELRVQYLIDAYRKLETGTHCELREEESKGLESAIADIQLFGTAFQIEKAQKFAETFATEGKAQLDELLNDLRNDLRRELQLDEAQTSLKYLRIHNSERPSNALYLPPPAASSSVGPGALLGKRRR